MTKQFKAIVLLTSVIFLFAECRKKEWDKYYNRPDSLEPPIYQQLESMGRFQSLLKLIDKSGYKQTLSAAGFWTFFAPNDDAFKTYLEEKGIGSIDAIDSLTSRAMIQYLLVYNAFTKDRLDDYQATAGNAGWTPSIAFRRRTTYYTGFYKDVAPSGKEVVALANNRNSKPTADGGYIASDYNNKYLTYFTDDYFSAVNLTAADYKYFYPQSEYTGFNVAQAKVLNKDIVAENGVIHEVDKVITPLMSIDEYIKTRPEYSSFRAILNRLYTNNMVSFIFNAEASRRYQILSGKGDSVFVKVYSNLLAFSPNNENSFKEEDNDGQKDCWTMFVPDNNAVDAYIKNKLCEFYPSLDEMPIQIIADFLNSHLFPTVVWPSKFAVTRNNFTEPVKLDPVADIFDRQFLSNGIVYGTRKIQEPEVFTTVFSKAYLNPKFTMMTRLLNFTGLKVMVAKSNIPVTVLMIPDNVFANAGYSYNETKDQYEYKPAGGSATTNGVNDRLTRILKGCVFFSPFREAIEDLSGQDIVRSGDLGIEGDYIKYNNNTIITSGLQDAGKVARVDSTKTAINGRVYYLSELPFFTENNIGYHIKNLGQSSTSPYNYFWLYLNSSTIFAAATNTIQGVNGFSTVFAPDNAAILNAVNAGLLPGTGTAPNKVPNFAPTAEADKILVKKFLQYHIVVNRTIVPDGHSSGESETLLQNERGDATKLRVFNSPDALSISDNSLPTPRSAAVILSSSNNLSNRSVIHLINDYLKY